MVGFGGDVKLPAKVLSVCLNPARQTTSLWRLKVAYALPRERFHCHNSNASYQAATRFTLLYYSYTQSFITHIGIGVFLSDIGRYILCISGTQKVSLMGCSSIVDSNLLRLGR
jgi:hypothetical protein